MKVDFEPYNAYIKSVNQIHEFNAITTYSYGLSQQLLLNYTKPYICPINIDKIEKKNASFSMADVKVPEIDIICEWVPFKKYADELGKSEEEIERMALLGELGPIKEDVELKKHLIWPAELKDKTIEELPNDIREKVIEYSVTVKASIPTLLGTEDLEKDGEMQERFLYLLKPLKKEDGAINRIGEMLYKSSLLMEWIAFETYLKSTIDELFRLDPGVLKERKHLASHTLTYKQICELSDDFRDVNKLRKNIVDLEIANRESGGKSVHGLIDLLKDTFKLKNPYVGWYVYRGDKVTTHYNDLVEIKEVRNSLVHDAGIPKTNLFEKYPSVPNDNGCIVIHEDYYLRLHLTLKTIAYRIAQEVSKLEVWSK